MNVVSIAALIVAVTWLAVRMSPPRRRKRRQASEQRALELLRRQEAADRALAGQWRDALAYCQSQPRLGLAHITHIYGAYPHRGTKAVLRWYGSEGKPQDTWFELAWPRLGDWLVVTGSAGYGRHNDNPDTFYAFIVGVVPAGAWEAWQRQQRQLVAG